MHRMDAANPRSKVLGWTPAGGGVRPLKMGFLHELARIGVAAVWAALALTGSGAANAQAVQTQDDDSYTIHGKVVNSVTRAAVPRALVFSTDNHYAKLTDEEGHFEFKVQRPQS